MQKVDQLIHAKWLITCEPNQAVLEHYALVCHKGLISAILPSHEAKLLYDADQELHLPTHALLPGFINSHTHSAMNLFRGLADDLELMDWLNNHIWPAEGKWVSDELVFDGTQLALAEMIRSGTTCFNDMYFFLDATARAVELAGLRANIGMTVIDVPTAWAKTSDEYFQKSIEFYQQYKNHPMVIPTLAPHSTYTVSIENLIRINELSKNYGLKINIHLQEAPAEINQSLSLHQKRPLQRLYEIGMLSPNLIAVHMTQINEADLDILQETQPNIVHCPESNMKLASGVAPVEKLMSHGLNVSLGTDGAASNNDLNMLGEMRSAAFLSKLINNNPKSLSAETVLQMATLNGAKTLGMEHLIGSLAIGKSADMIAIDLDQLETQPLYHPISQIVYAASRQQVTDVWVAGKQLLKNRQLTTIDEKELLKKAQKWRNRIKN